MNVVENFESPPASVQFSSVAAVSRMAGLTCSQSNWRHKLCYKHQQKSERINSQNLCVRSVKFGWSGKVWMPNIFIEFLTESGCSRDKKNSELFVTPSHLMVIPLLVGR